MSVLPTKKTFLQRQIPTILGLLILVVALGAGLVFFSGGTGVLAPRATPQTTPKNIKISNVTDTSFTVSFLTDEATVGFVKYGEEAGTLKSQASDDRDQLSGSVGKFNLHHITVRGLDAGKSYFYTLGTGSNASFDNNGAPFEVALAKKGGTPSAAKTIYGSVSAEGGTPAEGSIVYVSLAGVGEMSSLVKSSGSWAVPLSNARLADGSGYATIQDTDSLTVTVQGPLANQTTQLTALVSQAQPVAPLTLGAGATTATAPMPSPVVTPSPVVSPSPAALVTSASDSATTPVISTQGGMSDLLAAGSAASSSGTTASASATTTATASAVVNLEKTSGQVVTTSQPTIVGKAAPGVTISIEVHSDTQISQQLVANSDGTFSLDISKLQEQLEPGEHTVTYSYTDPATGQKVTKTQTFTVKGTASQLAAASTTKSTTTKTATTSTKTSTSSALKASPSPTPYGSGNPYPVGGTATKSTTASSSTRTSQPSTRSGVPVSGSVGTTLALMLGGLFFIAAAVWSFWVAQQLEEDA